MARVKGVAQLACRPIRIYFELALSSEETIVLGLEKSCGANDEATWKASFQLQEGKPLATLVSLDVDLDPENFFKAQETADSGLDNSQQATAKIAASVVKDLYSTYDDKRDAVQSIIDVRQTSGTGPR